MQAEGSFFFFFFSYFFAAHVWKCIICRMKSPQSRRSNMIFLLMVFILGLKYWIDKHEHIFRNSTLFLNTVKLTHDAHWCVDLYWTQTNKKRGHMRCVCWQSLIKSTVVNYLKCFWVLCSQIIAAYCSLLTKFSECALQQWELWV